MPTVAGDVVISQAHVTDSWYWVWRVTLDREQAPSPLTRSSTVSDGAAAMALARLMVRGNRGGAIYFMALDTLSWTKFYPD
jgi:hypothetical protein